MTNPVLDAARDYVSRGLSVIALSGKTPNGRVHRHGLKDCISLPPSGDISTITEALLSRAFEHRDTTGVGILTAYPLVVVDIDSEVGAQNWKTLAGAEFLPDTWIAKTRKGLHLYLGTIEPVNTFKPFGNDGGVDLKGDGGYVAAPPSAHPDGGFYEWLSAPVSKGFQMAPDALLTRIADRNFDRDRKQVGQARQKRVRHEAFEDGILYATWGFEPLFEGMTNAADGNRNNYLHWAAATMAEDGASDEEFEELREVALKVGLTHLEVKRTIRSARADRE